MATELDLNIDLCEKGKVSILHLQRTQTACLSDATHSIVIHCSPTLLMAQPD